MSHRLPIDAFEHDFALGAGRSYEAVGKHYEVTKRAVTKAAARERWSERLEKIERDSQARVDEKLTEDLGQMRLRHTKMLRAMASRAVRAIQEHSLESGMEGLKAAEIVIKLERLVAGDVTERSEVSIEQVVRREYEQLMVEDGDEADEQEGDGDGIETPVQ